MTLRGLIEAVEAAPTMGYGPSWNMANDALPHNAHLVLAAFNGSLDAVMALHDALLPGWRVGQLGQAHAAPDDTPDRWRAWIVAHDYLESTIQSEAESTDPARAWLLAILRALEGEP